MATKRLTDLFLIKQQGLPPLIKGQLKRPGLASAALVGRLEQQRATSTATGIGSVTVTTKVARISNVATAETSIDTDICVRVKTTLTGTVAETSISFPDSGTKDEVRFQTSLEGKQEKQVTIRLTGEGSEQLERPPAKRMPTEVHYSHWWSYARAMYG